MNVLHHYDRQFRVKYHCVVGGSRSRVGIDRESDTQRLDFLRNLLHPFDRQFRVKYHCIVDRSRSRVGIDRESNTHCLENNSKLLFSNDYHLFFPTVKSKLPTAELVPSKNLAYSENH